MKKERPLIKYEKLSKEDLVDYCRVYWRRIHNDEMLFNDIYKDIENLKEENRDLKLENIAAYRVLQRLEEENKKLKEEIEKLNLHIEAKDKAYMSLLKDYEELKNCGRYVFDCSKYDFTWLTSTTPQLEVSKKSESGSCFTKIE